MCASTNGTKALAGSIPMLHDATCLSMWQALEKGVSSKALEGTGLLDYGIQVGYGTKHACLACQVSALWN